MKFLLERSDTSSGNTRIALIVLVTVALIAFSIFYFDDSSSTDRSVPQSLEETGSATDSTQDEIIPGQVRYSISSTLSPRFTDATITPLQAGPGEKQNILVGLEDELFVDRVTATWHTSNGSGTIELELLDREQSEDAQISRWEDAWESQGFMTGLDLRGYAGESESLVELRF